MLAFSVKLRCVRPLLCVEGFSPTAQSSSRGFQGRLGPFADEGSLEFGHCPNDAEDYLPGRGIGVDRFFEVLQADASAPQLFSPGNEVLDSSSTVKKIN